MKKKFKVTMMCIAYLLSLVVVIPIILLALICGLVIYGIVYLEGSIVSEIWDDELTDMWNKLIHIVGDVISNLKEIFIFEMEL